MSLILWLPSGLFFISICFPPGADGTKGIKSLAKSKPVYVISQNAETCVVYGMPKSIAETGLVNEVVPLTQVAQTITKNVGVQ